MTLPSPDWQSDDGGVQLYRADCLEILPLLEAGSVDAVVTDPPYGIDGGKGGDSQKYQKGFYKSTFNDDESLIHNVVIPVVQIMLAWGVPMGMTTGTRWIQDYPRATEMGCFWTPAAVTHGRWGFTTFQPILYYGKDWRQGRCALPSGRVMTDASDDNGHPCPKPIGPWTWLVDKVAPLKSVVCDPFMGSGTTGVACIKTGRKFIGIEIDQGYFDIAVRRIKRAIAEQEELLPFARADQKEQLPLEAMA